MSFYAVALQAGMNVRPGGASNPASPRSLRRQRLKHRVQHGRGVSCNDELDGTRAVVAGSADLWQCHGCAGGHRGDLPARPLLSRRFLLSARAHAAVHLCGGAGPRSVHAADAGRIGRPRHHRFSAPVRGIPVELHHLGCGVLCGPQGGPGLAGVLADLGHPVPDSDALGGAGTGPAVVLHGHGGRGVGGLAAGRYG